MAGPSATRVAFEGSYVRVDVERWPGIGEWEVVHQLSAAAVLALTPSGEVILVRQFRPPLGEELLEIPAGLLDIEGEDALTCATRELQEETGYVAERIEFLGGVYAAPGSTDHYVHLFLARTASEPTAAPEAGITVHLHPFREMVRAAEAGRVRDAKTALALLMAAARPSAP